MKKFNSLFFVELQKIFRSKFIYVIILILLVLCLIMVASYEILAATGLNIDAAQQFETPEEGLNASNALLSELQTAIDNGSYKDTYHKNALGNVARQQQYYQYLVNNGLSFGEARPYSVGSMNNNYIDFTRLISQIALSFGIISVIVLGARNMAGEISSGAIKMTLVRPISRTQVLSAKMTATGIMGVSIFFLFTLLGAFYGMLRFGLNSPGLIMVTESSAVMLPSVAVLALEMLSGLFQLAAFLLLTYCISVSSRSKTAALALPLVIFTVGSSLAMLLQYAFIGYIELSFNLGFLTALQPGAQLFKGINVYSMLSISIVWVSILAASVYYRFRKFTI